MNSNNESSEFEKEPKKRRNFATVFSIIISLAIILSAIYFIYDFSHESIDDNTDPFSSFHSESPFGVNRLRIASADDEHVKPLGRTSFSDSTRWVSMSGSGIEFVCRSDYVKIKIVGDMASSQSYNHQARFAVFLNGNLVLDEVVDYDEKEYTVYTIGSQSDSVIRIVKLSEAMFSTFGIGDITVFSTGDIVPTAKMPLKIEFIGDSITCGYGIDEESPTAAFSTRTENFTKTYAYMTADKLNADYSTIAFSGYGVYTGYPTYGRKNDHVISAEYEKACLFLDGRSVSWDFYSWTPDIVVINLGTNDASYCGTTSSRDAFKESYRELIATIKKKYPNSYLLCILGDMNNSLYPSIEETVDEYISETYDFNIEAMTITFDMGNYQSVVDGHPCYMSNIIAADTLTKKIREISANMGIPVSNTP